MCKRLFTSVSYMCEHACMWLNIHIFGVRLRVDAMTVCSWGGDDPLASEQLDSAGFSVFMSRMNNYPGVAANSGDDTNSAWLQTWVEERERRKTCGAPSPNPLLSSHCLAFFSLFRSLSLSVLSPWIAGFVFLSVYSICVPSSSFLSIYFSFFPCPFILGSQKFTGRK